MKQGSRDADKRRQRERNIAEAREKNKGAEMRIEGQKRRCDGNTERRMKTHREGQKCRERETEHNETQEKHRERKNTERHQTFRLSSRSSFRSTNRCSDRLCISLAHLSKSSLHSARVKVRE